MKWQTNIIYLIFLVFTTSCSRIQLIEAPITMDENRERLSIEYLKARYNMDATEARIHPKMIVLHWTSIPTLKQTFETFDATELPEKRASIKNASQLNVSSHFVVDRDGQIYKLIPETYFARHVIGLNQCAIGIENVGGSENYPLTKAQKRANVKLVKYLSKKYGIEYLIGHYEYTLFIGHELWKETDPGYLTDKEDPGEDFMKHVRKKTSSLKLKGPPESKK